MTHPHPESSPRVTPGASAVPTHALWENEDRTVHARYRDDPSCETWELSRYDRQGRWYLEIFKDEGGKPARDRQRTAHEAVEMALRIEAMGGTIFEGRPGGGRFDYMVGAARQKTARAR